MPKWSKIEAGESVLLKGESYVVEAIEKKPKKGKAIVTINGRRGRFAGREVKLDDKVERGSDDPKERVNSRSNRDHRTGEPTP